MKTENTKIKANFNVLIDTIIVYNNTDIIQILLKSNIDVAYYCSVYST